jgi:quinolinate synthase
MADMIDPIALKSKLRSLRSIPVVTYVNSSAAVKALSTICCTSANIIEVVNSLDADEILMTPDRNLAQYAAANTDKKIHFWEGYCPIHDRLTPKEVKAVKKAHPEAIFIAHPECRPEVLQMADEVASTSGMIRFVKSSKTKEFIIGTEVGLLYPLSRQAPDKLFYPVSSEMACPDMKKISLQDVVACLETMQGQVKVPEEIRVPALKAVKRMIALKES